MEIVEQNDNLFTNVKVLSKENGKKSVLYGIPNDNQGTFEWNSVNLSDENVSLNSGNGTAVDTPATSGTIKSLLQNIWNRLFALNTNVNKKMPYKITNVYPPYVADARWLNWTSSKTYPQNYKGGFKVKLIADGGQQMTCIEFGSNSRYGGASVINVHIGAYNPISSYTSSYPNIARTSIASGSGITSNELRIGSNTMNSFEMRGTAFGTDPWQVVVEAWGDWANWDFSTDTWTTSVSYNSATTRNIDVDMVKIAAGSGTDVTTPTTAVSKVGMFQNIWNRIYALTTLVNARALQEVYSMSYDNRTGTADSTYYYIPIAYGKRYKITISGCTGVNSNYGTNSWTGTIPQTSEIGSPKAATFCGYAENTGGGVIRVLVWKAYMASISIVAIP